MKRQRITVKPHKGKWHMTGLGDGVIVYRFKYEAVSHARGACRGMWRSGQLAQMLVHRADGRFHYECTYGKDPNPPKG